MILDYHDYIDKIWNESEKNIHTETVKYIFTANVYFIEIAIVCVSSIVKHNDFETWFDDYETHTIVFHNILRGNSRVIVIVK